MTCDVLWDFQNGNLIFCRVTTLFGASQRAHSAVRNRGIHLATQSFASDRLATTPQRGVSNEVKDLRSRSNAHKFDKLFVGVISGLHRTTQGENNLRLFGRRRSHDCRPFVCSFARGDLEFVFKQRGTPPRMLTMQGGQQMTVRLASITEETA